MNNIKGANFLLKIVFLISFLGFYTVILLALNAGMAGFTRQLTIPMRGIIGGACILLFFLNFKNKIPYLKWFLIFVFFYSSRLFIDYINDKVFYISYTDLIFYFLSFSVIPFIGVIKTDFSKIDVKSIYKTFLFTALAFCILVGLSYSRFIGTVGRLSTNTTGEEDIISPLILSYCGTLIIGVCATYVFFNRSEKKIIKQLSYVAVALAFIPFFLGASRGSIIALFVPFFMLAMSKISFRNVMIYITFFVIGIFLLIYIDDYLGSGLIDRLAGTSEAIERGDSSASRVTIWAYSYEQFLNYPLFGDKLKTNGVDIYPHNIVLEVLQSVGIVGFIPFLILLFKGVISSIKVFKYHVSYAWIAIIFLQSLMQGMFSGAIYSSAWFWTSLAMVLSMEYYLSKTRKYESF